MRQFVQHSRYEPRMEWQPVRSAEKSREVQNRRIAEQETAQEVEHESEEDIRRRIKGKAPTEDSSDKEYNLESNFGASETLKSNGPAAKDIPEN